MRIWSCGAIFSYGCVLAFFLSTAPCTLAAENKEKATDYVYDDDGTYRSGTTSTAATTRLSSTSTFAVEVLATIVNLLISDFADDVNNAFRNLTTLASTTPAPVTTIAITPFLGNATTTAVGTGTSVTESSGPVVEILRELPENFTLTADNATVHVGILNASFVGNATSESAPLEFTVNTTATFETGETAILVNGSNFTTESDDIRFLIPENFTAHTIVESANITEDDNSTVFDLGELISVNGSITNLVSVSTESPFADLANFTDILSGLNDASNITVDLQSANASQDISTAHPTIPTLSVSANESDILNAADFGTVNGSADGLFPNQTDFLTETATITSTIETSTMAKQVQKPDGSCAHRLGETLTDLENDSFATLNISSGHKWTNDSELLICKYIMEKLCRYLKDVNGTDCAGFTLEIIDQPSFFEDQILVHFLILDPNGRPMNPDDVMKIIQDESHEMDAMLTQANHTNKGQKPSAPSSHRPFEHPLDNPVIATSLIAVVVTVCLVAMLSLLILVLLQRRRRSRKGEWIVNSKYKNTSAGAHQGPVRERRKGKATGLKQGAYGWCFENDGYSNDEKKRPTAAPLPPVQLLDDRRQRLNLPVDSPPFDVNCAAVAADSFPTPPPPPPLSSFNGCSNGGSRAPMASAAPHPAAGSSFNGWAPGGEHNTVEMEMTETAHGKNQRWY